MKLQSLGIALVSSIGLFIYGYVLSTTGHDHSAHEHVQEKKQSVEQVEIKSEHHNHNHGNSQH